MREGQDSQSTTVRVKIATHQAFRRLADRSGMSLTDYLERLATEAEEGAFWDSVDEAYRHLQSDLSAWSAEEDERRLLDNTVGDGLFEIRGPRTSGSNVQASSTRSASPSRRRTHPDKAGKGLSRKRGTQGGA